MKHHTRSKQHRTKQSWKYMGVITLTDDITYFDTIDDCGSQEEALEYFMANPVLLVMEHFTVSVRGICNDVTCAKRGEHGNLECDVYRESFSDPFVFMNTKHTHPVLGQP